VRLLGGWIDVFKIVRLSCGRLGGCGRGKGGGVEGLEVLCLGGVFVVGGRGGREGVGLGERVGFGGVGGGRDGRMSVKDQGVAGVENRVRVAERQSGFGIM